MCSLHIVLLPTSCEILFPPPFWQFSMQFFCSLKPNLSTKLWCTFYRKCASPLPAGSVNPLPGALWGFRGFAGCTSSCSFLAVSLDLSSSTPFSSSCLLSSASSLWLLSRASFTCCWSFSVEASHSPMMLLICPRHSHGHKRTFLCCKIYCRTGPSGRNRTRDCPERALEHSQGSNKQNISPINVKNKNI